MKKPNGTSLEDSRNRGDRLVADSVVRNTTYAFIGQLATSALTAALTLFLVRTLGPTQYGTYALALGVGFIAGLPADLGLASSAARFIAEHRGDKAAVGRALATAFWMKLTLALAVAACLFAGAGAIANAYNTPGLTWPLRVVAISVLGESLLALLGGAFVSLARVRQNLIGNLSESAIETTTSITLVVIGAGATGAAVGRASGYLCAVAVSGIMVLRTLGRAAFNRDQFDRDLAGRMVRYAGPLAIVGSAFLLFSRIDDVLIGALLGAASVGLFEAPMRLMTFLHYPGLSIAAGVAPRLARHPTEPPKRAALVQSLRLLVIFQAALVPPLLVWTVPIVHLLFGQQFAASVGVIRALVPYVFLLGFGPLLSLTANYLGEGRRRIPITVLALLVNVAIDVALIPRIGVVAAGIGTSIAYSIYAPAHLVICKRVLSFSILPLTWTLLRSVFAATIMAVVLWTFGHDQLSAPEWIVGGAAGILAYAAMLLLSREVTFAELASAYRFCRRRFSRTFGRTELV